MGATITHNRPQTRKVATNSGGSVLRRQICGENRHIRQDAKR